MVNNLQMASNAINSRMIKLKDISSAFSRSAFTDVLLFDDYSHFDWIHSAYSIKGITYNDLLKKAYSALVKDYRCEYVYKNELIKLLLRKYGTKNTVYFSEFRVGKSIADLVMFNGESKVFEIKTEYDSTRRLNKQMSDYEKIFDKCYLVVPKDKYEYYRGSVKPNTGIIVLEHNKGKIFMHEMVSAAQNSHFDSALMMSFLRAEEYQNITSSLGYETNGVAGFDMYKFCSEKIAIADTNRVRGLLLGEVKKRNNNTRFLRRYPAQLRQMMLSLNLTSKKADTLLDKLNKRISNL